MIGFSDVGHCCDEKRRCLGTATHVFATSVCGLKQNISEDIRLFRDGRVRLADIAMLGGFLRQLLGS